MFATTWQHLDRNYDFGIGSIIVDSDGSRFEVVHINTQCITIRSLDDFWYHYCFHDTVWQFEIESNLIPVGE